MFLFYGNINKLIKSYHNPYERCKNCNNNAVDIYVYQSYFHFYWIPVHPIDDKNALIYCSNCDAEIFDRELAANYISKTKPPFYMYTLLLLIGLVFILVFLVIISA